MKYKVDVAYEKQQYTIKKINPPPPLPATPLLLHPPPPTPHTERI